MLRQLEEGHICKRCGSDQSFIYDTRETKAYGFRRIRRRECKECGNRWITCELHFWEVVEDIQK